MPIIELQRAGWLRRNVTWPVKVDLRSASDCNYLLSATKCFKDNSSTLKVIICKWMNRNELALLKALKQKCNDLNGNSTPLAGGKKPYVTISGRLIRDSSGKLIAAVIDQSVKKPKKSVAGVM